MASKDEKRELIEKNFGDFPKALDKNLICVLFLPHVVV